MTAIRASVLLVEDDESLRRIVARAPAGPRLRRRRGRPRPRSAVAPLDGGLRPDVVLLDLNLPGDTGWDLLRGPALDAAGPPAGRRRERDDGEPAAPRASSASPATCPSPFRSRRSWRRSSGSSTQGDRAQP